MKRLLVLVALLSLPIFVVAPVSAQLNPYEDICAGEASGSSVCEAGRNGGNDPIAGKDGVIMRVVTILSYVVGFASVIMVMIGGLKFITANGDPNSISSARNTVLYALIGVAVFLSSQLIVRFVISRL